MVERRRGRVRREKIRGDGHCCWGFCALESGIKGQREREKERDTYKERQKLQAIGPWAKQPLK